MNNNMEAQFEVVVTNEILGDSSQIMSMGKIARFNLCALECAKRAAKDGKPHTMGMWTVHPVKENNHEKNRVV